MTLTEHAKYWLFSPTVDLTAFLGSAVLSLLLLAIGAPLGLLNQDTPEWAWVPAILLIDVAHVYATGFRVYFNPAELQRRPLLYTLTPILSFLVGWALYSEGASLFWRVLAYAAVFHFVRQQYGWVALYRTRRGEHDAWGRWIDSSAIYLATVFPLVYWHAHLPREFWWFRAGDFARLPVLVADVLAPVYWASLAIYVVRSAYRGIRQHFWNPGKDVVVATTAVCWHVGIITFNSDYAFTVTNVIIHGVPYLVLVYWYRFVRVSEPESPKRTGTWRTLVLFAATVWVLAYLEELIWDRGLWHERSWLFGGSWEVGPWERVLVPLLAVPQLTHYILDGFIWRRRSNPDMSK